jgi:integrase
MLGLRWRDLRLPERRHYVGQSKNGEPRVLPLTGGVVELLKASRGQSMRKPLLFASYSDPHKPYQLRKHWDTAVKVAGLTDFRFHDLRHTCASYLAQNGATLLQIADVRGHKQLDITKRYSHLCVDHKQDLVGRVLGDVR